MDERERNKKALEAEWTSLESQILKVKAEVTSLEQTQEKLQVDSGNVTTEKRQLENQQKELENQQKKLEDLERELGKQIQTTSQDINRKIGFLESLEERQSQTRRGLEALNHPPLTYMQFRVQDNRSTASQLARIRTTELFHSNSNKNRTPQVSVVPTCFGKMK